MEDEPVFAGKSQGQWLVVCFPGRQFDLPDSLGVCSRLGLVLAEIGRAHNVQVTDQELNAAILQEARNYPGQEQAVLNFYRQNPNAAAQMRAPIYEEKVVDLIVGLAEVTDKPISKEELLKEDEEG